MKNEVNTTENNILLAEFMNWEFTIVNNSTLQTTLISNLDFSKDWNVLMQVVEKIESLEKKRFSITITPTVINVWDNTNDEDIIETRQLPLTKIEAVHNACVKFVKWYNENGGKENKNR